MMNDERWAELQQAEDMAYFRADLCCYSPESYSLDEKKEICNDMISTSKAVLDACVRTSSSCQPMLGASSSTRSASRGSKAPIGGGMCSWVKASRSIASWSR